jgi:LmbE family N-acetylglucosaminyl deacetylase
VTEPLTPTRADRLLVLAPHPDDETLATGGLLQRAQAAGAEVRVLFVTDGENNPWAQRATERRWRIAGADRERWGERRRGEALAALACLGISPWQTAFLGFPDQGIHGLLLAGDEDLAETLGGEIERFRPTLLVAPSLEDLHPDHSALAVFVRLALARLDATLRPPRERQFIVHHDGPLAVSGRGARLDLAPEECGRKRRAILCHASQLRLRRGALLSFAAAAELYFTAASVGEHCAEHPVRHASVEGEALVLELARSSRPGAFGATGLLLALQGPGSLRTLIARLPGRTGAFELYEWSGGTLVARGEMRRAERGTPERVVLPAAVLAGWAHAFVKLERRFGFFDEAGWRALPCLDAQPDASERAAARATTPGVRDFAQTHRARRDSQ